MPKETLIFDNAKKRDSNFEILRILTMLMIIAYHYVVNSGMTSLYDFNNITGNMIFLQIFGIGGKIGINIFLMITGYFMVKTEFRLMKCIVLWGEIVFYNVLISITLFLLGYDFSTKVILQQLFPITHSVQHGFIGTFIFLYIMIPFINILLHALNQKQHKTLLLILLYLFTIISTFLFTNDTFSELGWYITVYIIAGYIRIYPNVIYQDLKLWVLILVVTYIMICGSIIGIDFMGAKTGFIQYHWMFINAHKLFAVTTSVSIFMIFKNLKIKYNKHINNIAKTTFGVLLIHGNSDEMRQFLWKDFLNNMSFYNSEKLILHAVFAVLGVYVICVIIDLLRIKFVEIPLLEVLKKRGITEKVNQLQNILYN